MNPVQVEQPRRLYRIQSDALQAALGAGWAPLAIVAAAGFTLGFFLWYAAIAPRALPASGVLLPVLLLAGIAGAVWFWRLYSDYFASRTGIKQQRALQYDAIAWSPFVLLWLAFVLPLWLTHGGARLFVYCLALFCIGKLAIAARFNETVRDVAVDFIVTRFAIIVIAELAAVIIGQRAGTHVQESRTLLLAVWGRWDAVHFIDIAVNGYHGTDVAFFPFFPILIALLGKVLGNHLVAGLIVSNVAFFFALLFLYKLVEHEFDRNVARRAIFYISIFPTAVFFSAVYTEALFLMLTVASFYYMREHKWAIAGVLGFFAALTRVEGLLLVVPFAIELWNTYGTDPRAAMRAAWPIALIPLGLLTFMGYLWILNGDALAFSHVQSHWNRQLSFPWTSIGNSVHKIATAVGPQTTANQVLELFFTAMMIGILIAGWRKLKASYIAYMALSILMPLCTSSLMSMPRFALVLFPMFVIMALWGGRAKVNNAILAFSLPLLGLFTVLFADWYWVA